MLLAVSLLKDRHGTIDVNLPISGSLDDPKFSIGGIVLRIIFNLIEKAVTSPFALIGNLVGGGGGEDLSTWNSRMAAPPRPPPAATSLPNCNRR